MNDALRNYAIPETKESKPSPIKRSPSNKNRIAPSVNHTTNYILTGLILLVILLLIPFLWNLKSEHKTEYHESELKQTHEDTNLNDFRLDLNKIPDGMSLNEYVNIEISRLLPNSNLDEKFSVFLSSDISEKMMKLYHEESLNIFKTKIDEYDVHKNILKEKYAKGRIIGAALLKEIESYELCHPALHDLKDKLVHLISQYNGIFNSKNTYDSVISNFLGEIRKKEAELAKIKKDHEIERSALEKNMSDIRYQNMEDKLKKETERLKTDIENINKFLDELPNKIRDRNEKLSEYTNQLEIFIKEISEMQRKKDDLAKIAESVEQEAKELSSKEILDILKSDYNSRIQKLQNLAQTILDSIVFEKNEVYFHKKATQEEKESSKKTLKNIKNRYEFILKSIIKVSQKMYNRTKNQAESDEKANQYQSFYSQIKEIDGKIDSLQIKVKDVQAQIRRIKDEIMSLETQKEEKKDALERNEANLSEKEALYNDIRRKMKEINDELKELNAKFDEKEKDLNDQIMKLQEEKREYERSKGSYTENLNKAYKEFAEKANQLNKKINDCKINENLIQTMNKNFLSFFNELEKFQSRRNLLENEIRKMYESLENQANLPDH